MIPSLASCVKTRENQWHHEPKDKCFCWIKWRHFPSNGGLATDFLLVSRTFQTDRLKLFILQKVLYFLATACMYRLDWWFCPFVYMLKINDAKLTSLSATLIRSCSSASVGLYPISLKQFLFWEFSTVLIIGYGYSCSLS